ncbi:carbohydrate ABC transporter permease [Ruminiclostridium cellobioparum]|jgi:putative chitobiose transport system permease protein|uniref:carbohydrate ABC transporter permease n=1 Tax=Ruminiclostridium cellobioparum TaxID=29355 RepID=UPI0005584806|nr:sugar ABC transporter permease [Ruminiclostridium cellobioparum]
MRLDGVLKRRIRENLVAYAFMAPALIVLAVFVFYPIIYSIPLAFYDYSGIGESHYIGFDNFIKAFHDEEFWIAIRHSIQFVLVVPIIQILSILLATLVNKKLPGISIFRVLIYIPVVTSMIAVSIIWNWIFDEGGVLNAILMNIGLLKDPVLWLGDANLALFTLMFITIWQGLGYYMMLYLAGLQSLPPEMEEAAIIDGAGRIKTFIKIKIPLLKPYVWFCSLMSVISAVSVFDVVFAIKDDGGPDNATLVANLYSYRKAFVNFEFGYSAAVGVLVSIVILALSVFVFIYGRRGGMSNNE